MSLDPTVSVLLIDPFPLDARNGHHWRVQIRRDHDGLWQVYSAGMWLQPDYTWYPDQRTALRVEDRDNAVQQAQWALKGIVVGETTWDDMCAKWGVS